MADVILVQPKLEGGWDRVLDKPNPPLSLLSLCRYVHNEREIKIIDTRLDKNWKNSLQREVNKKPMCIGITSVTGMQIMHALEISKFTKECSNVPVVWGGVHASLLPYQVLKNPYVDFVVKGEGEIAFKKLLDRLEKSQNMRGVKGVWYKNKGEIKSNPDSKFVDLNTLPKIPYHLVDMNNYNPLRYGQRSCSLETSRGCLNNCAFCSTAAINKGRWRALRSQNVLKEIEELISDFRIKDVFFIDENFFPDKKRVKDIMLGLIKRKLDLTWQAGGVHPTFLTSLDKDYINLLKLSNCKRLVVGLESGSPRILRLIGKNNINLKRVIKINKLLKKVSTKIWYHFVFGFPYETELDRRLSINLMFRLLKDNPNACISRIAVFAPYPKTILFEASKKLGLEQPKSLEEWASYNSDSSDLPWFTKKINKDLRKLYLSSQFLDKKTDYISSPLIRFLANAYRPIAKFRVKNLFFKFYLEEKIKNLLLS